MERDEIIEMARTAGFTDFDEPNRLTETQMLSEFAKLVASAAIAKEREACAVLASKCNKSNNNGTHLYIADTIRARSAATSRGEA